MLELVNKKCMSAMLYGVDACPINKSQRNSLQFAVTGMLMKLFRTKSRNVIDDCMILFGFATIDKLVLKRKQKFLFKYINCENLLCKLFTAVASSELNSLNCTQPN